MVAGGRPTTEVGRYEQIHGEVDDVTSRSDWLLRWDTADDGGPEVLGADGRAGLVSSSGSRAGTDGFALFDGYLFDRRELCAELRIDLQTPEPTILRSAYDRWGDALFDKLRGGYVAALWDEAERSLAVARDALGLHSCFFWWDGRLLLLSPSIERILGEAEVARKFNRPAVAEFLIGAVTRHQVEETLYAGVRRLPPAHTLSLAGGALTLSRCWDPLPPDFAWADRDERAQFDALLERAVARCLLVGADSIALSGGFDSVGLAVVAAGQLEGKAPLQAISLRFPQGACDEGAVQTAVAGALGMPQLIRTFEESLDGESPVRAALDVSTHLPCPVLSIWQAMYTGLFRSARERGCQRTILGTGGDDMMIVDLSYGADCLRALRLPTLWRFFRSWQRTSPFGTGVVARELLWKGALRPVLRRSASEFLARIAPGWRDRLRVREWERSGLPEWFSRADEDLLFSLRQRRLISSRPSARRAESYQAAMSRLTLAPMLLFELDQAFSWAAHLGITFFYPYLDRDVVELSLRIHPEHLIAGGRSKAPLRRLVAQRLPKVALPAKKVDFSQEVHRVFRTEGRQVWKTVGNSLWLAEERLVDPGKLRSLVDGYFEGRNNCWAVAWQLLSTEMWLRQQNLTS